MYTYTIYDYEGPRCYIVVWFVKVNACLYWL